MEYSEGRHKRMRGQQARRRRAFPAAGPVTVTRVDGTIEVQPPLKGGDKPGYQGNSRWTAADTQHSTYS
jgi:hypothetical protein